MRNELPAPADTPPAGSPAGLLLLGMHRSLTSLTATLLENAGFYIGEPEERMPARADNAEGFGERKDVYALNEWILETELGSGQPRWPMGQGWLRPVTVIPEQLSAPGRLHARSCIREISARLGRTGSPWLLKDPRCCLTGQVWKDFLPRFSSLLVFRDPLQVVRSLQKRDQLHFAHALALWELHMRAALEQMQGAPGLILHTTSLLQNPDQEMLRISDFLESAGFTGIQRLSSAHISGVLRPEMIHSQQRAFDDPGILNASQLQLLRQLEAGDLSDPGPLSQSSREALADFERENHRIQAQQDQYLQLERSAEAYAELAGIYRERQQQQNVRIGNYDQNLESLMQSRLWRMLKKLRNFHVPLPGLDPVQLETNFRTLQESHRQFLREQPVPLSASRSAKVVALLSTDHDEIWIETCIEQLLSGGLEILLLDLGSTDQTLAKAEKYLGRGLLGIERLSERECLASKQALLEAKLARSESLAADWFLLAEPKEFFAPPPGFASLQDWITESDRQGINALNFLEYRFLPCRECPDHAHPGFQDSMRWYYPYRTGDVRNLKAWKKQQVPVRISAESGGCVDFAGLRRGVQPGSLRHYLFLRPETGTPDPVLPSVTDLNYFVPGQPLSPHNPRLTADWYQGPTAAADA